MALIVPEFPFRRPSAERVIMRAMYRVARPRDVDVQANPNEHIKSTGRLPILSLSLRKLAVFSV